MFATAFIVTFLCLVVSYVVLQHTRRLKPRAPYPPGPPPKPIIGNALDVPFKKSWLKYIEWSKQYNSGIVHVCALNYHIVILNKMEDIVELMERRSSKYSSRPLNRIIDLLGVDMLTSSLPYGVTFRKHRKFMEENLRKDIIHRYRPLVTEKVHIFLGQLLHDPAGFEEYCNTLATSVPLAATFGYDLTAGQKEDPFVEAGQFAISSMSEIYMPGRTLMTVVPLLTYIPPWFPGASSQRFAAKIRDAFIRYKTGSFEYVKRNMAAGTAKDSIAKRLLERVEQRSSEDEKDLMNAVLILYIAAVETAQIGLVIAILAMTVFPVEQRKAQQEIDRVVGSDRLPTFVDRCSLPYVEAFYREILRWRPITPLAAPHATDEDDVYQGYYIPKGSLVFGNVWIRIRAITRDERRYADPEEFLPERFFKDGTLNDDNVEYIFGFGRRVCPGRHIADSLLWLTITSVLAMFNISKAKDENGNTIDVDASVESFSDAITSRPLPFKCAITPRGQLAADLVRDAADAALQRLNN